MYVRVKLSRCAFLVKCSNERVQGVMSWSLIWEQSRVVAEPQRFQTWTRIAGGLVGASRSGIGRPAPAGTRLRARARALWRVPSLRCIWKDNFSTAQGKLTDIWRCFYTWLLRNLSGNYGNTDALSCNSEKMTGFYVDRSRITTGIVLTLQREATVSFMLWIKPKENGLIMRSRVTYLCWSADGELDSLLPRNWIEKHFKTTI